MRDGEPARLERDLDALGRALVSRFALVLGGVALRLIEVELYYYGAFHKDPFAHRHPLQRTPCRWYFHRQGEAYRGGSFKGLDLTFGHDAFGGALIRAVRGPEGVIDGPCRVVEHLLSRLGERNIAALDRRIGDRPATASAPLGLAEVERREGTVVRTARIGLTLKRPEPTKPAFLGRRDRFLAEPRAVRAGKLQTALALHEDGLAEEAISLATGSPRRSVRAWIDAFDEGRGARVEDFAGRGASGVELARLLGAVRGRLGG